MTQVAFGSTVDPVHAGDRAESSEAEELAGHFQRRCPVFTTLEKAARVELTVATA